MLILLYIIVVYFGFLRPRNNVAFALLFLVAWILVAGNYQNPDYEQYIFRYERGLEVLVDFGFSLLCYTFSNLGFDYQTFKGILSFVCLLLVFRTIAKLCNKPAAGAALFAIFPFIIDITQFRNFIAYSIVFSAIPYLYEKGVKSTIKYIVIVLIAASVHATSIFYILFVITKYNIKLRHVVVLAVTVGILKEMMKQFFTLQFETTKLENGSQSTTLGAIFGSILVILNLVIIWYVYRHYKGSDPIYKIKASALEFCTQKTWPLCNLLLILIIPFLFDNGNYSRIYRNIVVLNAIFIYDAFYIKRSHKILIISLYYLYMVYANYLSGTYFDEVVSPVFKFNSLISIL